MQIETADMEPFEQYIRDVGYWKHQCYILSDFDWRKAKDMYQNASMEEVVNMIRGRYHYHNSGNEE